MSAANFHNVNASRIFAVELSDDEDYRDLILNLENDGLLNDIRDGGNDEEELRSYPSKVLGRIYRQKEFKEHTLEVEATLIVRSGYYSGVNLDWQIKYYKDGDECEINEIKTGKSFLEKETKNLICLIENVYRDYSKPLTHVATFSNGEAIYQTEEERNRA